MIACDETVDLAETTLINPDDKSNNWLIVVVLLAITCFSLLVVIVDKYYMKRGLTIPCLLSN